MSANNWVLCPNCANDEKKRLDELRAKVNDLYGKIPRKEYLALLKESTTPVNLETTLSEYWEIGIYEDGEFFVDYRGSCSVCGFSHTFRHKEQVCDAR